MRFLLFILSASLLFSCNKKDESHTPDCLQLVTPTANAHVPYDTAAFTWRLCQPDTVRFIIYSDAGFTLPVFDTVTADTSQTLIGTLLPDTTYFARIMTQNDTVLFSFSTSSVLDDVVGNYTGLYVKRNSAGDVVYSAPGTFQVSRGSGEAYLVTHVDDSNMAGLEESMIIYSAHKGYAYFSAQTYTIMHYRFLTDSIDITREYYAGVFFDKSLTFSGVKQ